MIPNFLKVFVLWVNLGRSIKIKKRALRFFEGTENDSFPEDFDFDHHYELLRDAKKVFQERAIQYDNMGYPKIADRFLILKETTVLMINILLTWEKRIEAHAAQQLQELDKAA